MKNQNPTSLVTIINNGKDIIEPTNYWNSEMAMLGFCLVSTNAGCIRLLVPDNLRFEIPDMVKKAKHAVISLLRTHDTAARGEFVVSILMEDNSRHPYSITLSRGRVLNIPLPEDKAMPWTFAIWGRKNGKPHKYIERPAFIRYADTMPCLRPYDPAIDGV
jgi:hypothetical protein